jgi:hypothetical protein
MDTKAAGVLGVCIVIASFILTLVPRGTAVPEVGRYQFARSSGANCFVLDTRTGRLWQRYVDPSGGSTNWSEDKTPWTEVPAK